MSGAISAPLTAASTQRAAAPAIGAEILVPATVAYREVYGTTVSGSLDSLECQVETGVGTGVFQTVQQVSVTLGEYRPFSFKCVGGRRYRFANAGAATVQHYSYLDVS